MSAASLTSHAATNAIASLGGRRPSQALGRAPGALTASGALGASGALASAQGDVRARARSQAVEFESVFLNSMFSQMFTAVDGEGPMGGGGGGGVWRSFLTDEYAKSFARAGGIGIADHVYRALLGQQEAAQAAAPAGSATNAMPTLTAR
jgi:flagellar protein FlgJ